VSGAEGINMSEQLYLRLIGANEYERFQYAKDILNVFRNWANKNVRLGNHYSRIALDEYEIVQEHSHVTLICEDIKIKSAFDIITQEFTHVPNTVEA
jgi:hypothetical protein